jgi:uncharacterized protein YmfQ (DUF2313 family)
MATFDLAHWNYAADSHAQALMRLMPVGPAWPDHSDMGSVQGLLLTAFAQEMARLNVRVCDLITESNPATSTELLVDWESELALPDPCVTTAQTVAERRTAAGTKLTSPGGGDLAFFINLAAQLGYTITITEFASSVAATAAGISFSGDQWAFIWRVNVPVSTGTRYFTAGAGTAGDPLETWGDQLLECRFNQHKPAHTQVVFAYAP